VISAECGGGGDGPSERGCAAVCVYLEAIPSPPASALIDRYNGSLSPDGITPASAVAIALHRRRAMELRLPRSQDGMLANFDGSAATLAPPTDIAPYEEAKLDGPPPKVDVEEKAFPAAGGDLADQLVLLRSSTHPCRCYRRHGRRTFTFAI
jgi:hypothetical protein